MKCRCDRCGKMIDVEFASRLKAIFTKKISECDICSEISSYERNEGNDKFYSSIDIDYITIGCFEDGFYEWLESNVGKRCAVLLCDEKHDKLYDSNYYVGYLTKGNKGWVSLYEDKRYDFPIIDVKNIQLFEKGDRRYEKPDNTAIYGYKGLVLENGILKSLHGHIYELGIPYIEDYKNPISNVYNDLYSHFCLSMEDVMDYRDYIGSVISNDNKQWNEFRLFKVKVEGHYFQNSPDGKGWVTNCLTVLHEVEQSEIIKYYEKDEKTHGVLLQKLRNKQYSDAQEIWQKYRECQIEKYRDDYSDEEALALCVQSAPQYGNSESCLATVDVYACKRCDRGESCFFGNSYSDYCYLVIRNKIKRFEGYEDSEEYKYLLEDKNSDKKIHALHQLCRVCDVS